MLAAEGACAKDEDEEVRLRVRLLREEEDERWRRATVGFVGEWIMCWPALVRVVVLAGSWGSRTEVVLALLEEALLVTDAECARS